MVEVRHIAGPNEVRTYKQVLKGYKDEEYIVELCTEHVYGYYYNSKVILLQRSKEWLRLHKARESELGYVLNFPPVENIKYIGINFNSSVEDNIVYIGVGDFRDSDSFDVYGICKAGIFDQVSYESHLRFRLVRGEDEIFDTSEELLKMYLKRLDGYKIYRCDREQVADKVFCDSYIDQVRLVEVSNIDSQV